jgi:hypothetical protein
MLANSSTVNHKKQWFISSKIDQFFLFFLTPIASILLVIMMLFGIPELVGILILGVIVDIPHQVQTHLLLLSNSENFNKHKSIYFGSLVVIFSICCIFAALGMIIVPVTFWAYWIIYHVVMQHFGLAAVYARRNGYLGSTNTLKFIILLGSIAPITFRMATTGLTFGTPIQGIEIITPQIPVIIPYCLYIISGVFLLYSVYTQYIIGKFKLPIISNCIMLYTLAQYNLFFLLEKDLLVFLIFSTLIHAIQYHLIAGAKIFNSVKKLYSSPATKIEINQEFVRYIISNNIIWPLFVILVSLFIFIGNSISYGVIPLTWAMHHFFLDGVIWKRQHSHMNS